MREFLRAVRLYWNVYRKFLSTSISEALGFRVNFVLLVLIQSVFCVTSLLTIHFLYSAVDHIGMWSESEFLFFTSFMLTVNTLHDAFITRNYWEFSDLLIRGKLDFILLRPLHPVFSAYFRFSRPSMMIMTLPILSATVYFGIQVPLSWQSWLFLPFLLFLGVALMGSLGMLFTCGMFWLLQGSGVNFIRIQAQEVARWPDYIFGGGVRLLFTMGIPLLLVGSAPVRFLLNPSDCLPMLGLLCAVLVVFRIVLFLWSLGLRNYDSASS